MPHGKRRIGVPLILLWALAHGMWIGAGMHAGTQLELGAPRERLTCACACLSVKPTSQLRSANATSAQACAVCALGIIAPDVPIVTVIATVPPLPTPRASIVVVAERIAAPQFLPPSRAPPAA